MDNTLAQILSRLFAVELENQQLRMRVAELENQAKDTPEK